MENSFAKISDALTIQNDLIYNGSRVFIPVAYRKQVIEKLHDVHQGVNALKCIVKNVAWWPLMDNDIEQFVKNCPECNQHRPRLNDSTDKWNECAPWERLHMDWLYDAEYGNILVIADAGSGWLEAFPCTDRSTRNVVRCLRTCFSRFGIPFTVVSDNGKEFISKDLKDWLTAQGCYKTDTPLYSPRSNGLAERAVQTMKRSLKFYNKNIGCTLSTYIDKVLFSHRNSSNARGSTPAKLLLGRSLRNPILGFYDVGEKVIYKPTVNHEPRELTYIIRKGRNTAWLHDNNRPILASDGQIAPLPRTTDVKTEPSPNNGSDVIEISPTPTGPDSDCRNPVSSVERTVPTETTDRPRRTRIQTQKYQAGFS